MSDSGSGSEERQGGDSDNDLNIPVHKVRYNELSHE